MQSRGLEKRIHDAEKGTEAPLKATLSIIPKAASSKRDIFRLIALRCWGPWRKQIRKRSIGKGRMQPLTWLTDSSEFVCRLSNGRNQPGVYVMGLIDERK